MKKTVFIITVVLLVFILPTATFSQQQSLSWGIEEHNTDPEALSEQIKEKIQDAFIPFGMSYTAENVYVLYMKGPGISAQEWQLKWYEDNEKLKNGIQTELANGFVPAGVSYSSDLFFILYLKTGWRSEIWSFVPLKERSQSTGSENEGIENGSNEEKELSPAYKEKFAQYLDNNFIPVGITDLGDSIWPLAIKADFKAKRLIIEDYEENIDELQNIVNGKIKQGFIPYGLMVKNGKDGAVTIMYVKF